MSTKIIIDSTVDIIEEQRSGVYMVPLTVRFGTEEFLDRVTISCEEFYTRLASCKELPTTSQPSPASFAVVYDEISAAGDEAVVVTISARISRRPTRIAMRAARVTAVYSRFRVRSIGGQRNMGRITTGYSLP